MSAPKITGLAAARLRLLDRQPYLAAAAMGTCETTHVPIAAVDAHGRLYIGPDFARLSPRAGAAVIAHECWHNLRQHFARLGDPDAAGRKNIAADCEINDDDPGGEAGLAVAAAELATEFCAPEIFGLGTGQTAEWYLANLPPDAGAPSGAWAGDLLPDDHPAVRAADAAGVPRLSGPERQAQREAVARAIQARGDAPGDARRWADETLAAPAVDWRRELRAVLGRAIAAAGERVATYGRPSRREAAPPILRAGHRRLAPHIAVVIDTSGSMGAGAGSPLLRAAAEVRAIARVSGECSVIACDAKVQARGRAARRVDISGGGGTDMRVGLAAAAADRPDTIICVTDCQTPWPDAAPRGTRVIVCAVGPDAAPSPGWARRVEVLA